MDRLASGFVRIGLAAEDGRAFRFRMRLLVTAGPTHEAIDPVRYLANRSSGKMGFAVAAAGAARGWEVVLVAGPVALATPPGVRRVDVVSARDMHDAVCREVAGADAAVFAAAVADFRPVVAADRKIKKSTGLPGLVLEPTADILGAMRGTFGFRGVLVGFAAETNDLLAGARAKLDGKGCDLVVANDVSRSDIGFGSEDNEAVILHRADRREEHLPKMPKAALADAILERVAALL